MIEVEIKVSVTDKQAEELIVGAQCISKKVLITEFYDSADYKLTTKGFWLRRRDGVFELKSPATKDKSHHAMHEIQDEQKIRRMLGLDMHGTLQEVLTAAGIGVLYRFTNTRQTYTKDGFTIDFDRADFGDLIYSVCEIETLVESADQTQRASDSLHAFAKRYGISTERVEGKLEHYIRIKNPAHYYAITHSVKKQK